MSFASPVFFWALLSLIPLAAIYLLKVRPVRKPTTAWFLWQDIFQEKKATSLFQRFRDLLSLLLMALAFAAIVLAMTRPNFSGDQQRDLILLIDNSASMNSSNGSGTRLESAKNVASEIIQALNGNQRCSVATIATEINFLSNLTDNPKELLLAVEAIDPTVLPSNTEPLLQIQSRPAATSTGSGNQNGETVAEAKSGNGKKPPRIILVTDGCLGGEVPDGVELLKVGDNPKANVGIVACDMRRLPGGTNRVGVFVQVASTFKRTVEAELTLSFDQPDDLTKFVPLEVKPGLNEPVTFEIEDAQAGKWFAQLDVFPKDSLPADDLAYISLPPRKPIPIAVVAEDRYFYENCVQAFESDDGLLALSDQSNEQTQLLIGAGDFAISESYRGDLLVFQPQGKSPFWSEVGEEIEVLQPRVVDENHPAIRHIDAALLPFVGARRITVPEGAEVLVKARDDTPLVYRASSGGRSAIVLNFDPLASDFYFSAWFPVVVYSAATHLAGRTQQPPATWATGQYAAIQGAEPGKTTSVTLPDGSEISIASDTIGPLMVPGFYELKNENGQWLSSCSLLSETETLNRNGELESNANAINRGSSPSAWLTILAVAVLVIESVLYQRRRVG